MDYQECLSNAVRICNQHGYKVQRFSRTGVVRYMVVNKNGFRRTTRTGSQLIRWVREELEQE